MSNELVTALNKKGPKLKKDFLRVKMDVIDLVVTPTGSDIVRSFHRGEAYAEYKPSSLLRHWIFTEVFGDTALREALFEESDFIKLHTDAVQSLQGYWGKNEPNVKGPEYYQFTKVIDVLFKNMPKWDELDEMRSEWFFNNAYCPIDKYSLLTHSQYNKDHRKSEATMGYPGNDSNKYKAVQDDFRDLIGSHPLVLYDLYVWEVFRPKWIKEEVRRKGFERIKVDKKGDKEK